MSTSQQLVRTIRYSCSWSQGCSGRLQLTQLIAEVEHAQLSGAVCQTSCRQKELMVRTVRSVDITWLEIAL